MAFMEYFQTKCPACQTKLKPRALGKPKPFSGAPVSAGQCPACKAPLQWLRSWSKAVVIGVFGVLLISLFSFVLSMVAEGRGLSIGGILGISLAMGFMSSKALAVAKTPPPS